jgi:WD40 repeat protein
VVFGAYDRAVHFLDADTGERLLPDFPTGDLIKGSVTVDPDGFPLIYVGSRDNNYRVIAIDRDEPTELYRLNARDVSPTLWNDDWDGAGLVLGDYLVEGGENSQFHVVKLNRAYGPGGKVQVAPDLVFHTPGWDDELLGVIGDTDVSIENSVAVWGSVVYFANSGGLVQGWDLAGLAEGRVPQRVFRYWTGDDTDASIVIDEAGALYIGVEHERENAQIDAVGQMIKLDPRRIGDPLVWSVRDPVPAPSGVWGTPGIYKDLVI